MSLNEPTQLEKENLEVHVDLDLMRYGQLDKRLEAIETKTAEIHKDINNGNKHLIKVIIGAVGSVVAGLLSTIVVLLMNM